MKKLVRIFALASLGCASLAAHASQPWYVDWSYTAPYKQFVLRLSFLDNDQIKSRTLTMPRMQLSYGLTPSVELYVVGNELQTQYPIKVGYSDTTFGVKTKLWGDKKGNQFGLRYEFGLPSANDGLGSGKPSNALAMLDTLVLTPQLKLYTMLGETVPETMKSENYAFYGALLGYCPNKKWMLGTELFGNQPAKPGAYQERAVSFGAMYQANDDLKLYAKVSHSMEGFSRGALTVGFQYTFGKK